MDYEVRQYLLRAVRVLRAMSGKASQAVLNAFKRSFESAWYYRSRLPILGLPMLVPLPYGGWFLLYPDEMGLSLLPRPWKNPSRSYEEGEWRFVQRFVKPGMVCFDIGANQGFYTILLSKRVGERGRVFAFEPVGGELRKLKRNLGLNRCQNVVVEKIALGSSKGLVDVLVCLDGRGSHSSLRPRPDEVNVRTEVEHVPITTLDAYVGSNNIRRLDFVKLDVEGSERDVLSGAVNVLDMLRPVILIEMNDAVTQHFGYHALENYVLLESHKFELFEVSVSGLLRSAIRKEYYRQNLIAVPREKSGMISYL